MSSLLPIWGVFMTAQVAFAFAPWAMLQLGNVDGVTVDLGAALPFVAAVDLVLAVLLPRALWRRAAETLAKTSGALKLTAAEIVKITAPGLILQLVLLELINLMGVLHAIMAQDPRFSAPYAAIAVLGTLLAIPKEATMRERLARRG